MSNPVIKSYAGFDNSRNTPSYQDTLSRRSSARLVTLDDVLVKTLVLFAMLIPTALATYLITPPVMLGTVMLASLFATLGLGLVSFFMKRASKFFIFLYTIVQGIFTGAISAMYAHMFAGAVGTAVVATTITALVVIAGVKVGFLRTSNRARQIFGYLLMGYFAFTLIAIGASLLGFGFLHFGSPLLLVVAAFGVGMATFSFVTEVENIKYAISNGAPKEEDWRLAFGLVVSLVWLYLEILRFIAALTSMFSSD